MKNVFEMFKDKELAPELQSRIESRMENAETEQEKWFVAGFMVHCEIERMKKIMGEDNWSLGIKIKGQ